MNAIDYLKYRTLVGGGAAAPVLQAKSARSGLSDATVEPDQGYDGLSSVTVLALRLQSKTAKSTSVQQVIEPDSGKDGLSSVTVQPLSMQAKTAKSGSTQQIVEADSGYDGLSSVTVEPLSMQAKTAKSGNSQQVVEADSGYDGLSSVTVQPLSMQSKSVTPSDSQQVVEADSGYDGLSAVTVGAAPAPVLQTKSATPTRQSQDVEADSGYDGLSRVTVAAIGYEETQNGSGVKATIGGSGGVSLIDPRFLTRLYSAASDIELSADVDRIGAYALYFYNSLKKITLPNAENIFGRAFSNCQYLITVEAPKLKYIDEKAFESCFKLQNIALDGGNIWKITSQAFINCSKFAPDKIIINTTGQAPYRAMIDDMAFYNSGNKVDTPYTIKLYQVGIAAMSIGNNAFGSCTKLKQFNFVSYESLPLINAYSFTGCTALTDIYVPWSSGEVSGSPWGAANATIHYNTVFDANGDPITS